MNKLKSSHAEWVRAETICFPFPDEAARRALAYDANVRRQITLDSVPAHIVGWNNDTATVTAWLPGPRVEFSWAAVARIVARDGRFYS